MKYELTLDSVEVELIKKALTLYSQTKISDAENNDVCNLVAYIEEIENE